MGLCFSKAPRYLKSLRFRKTIKVEGYFNLKSFFIDDSVLVMPLKNGISEYWIPACVGMTFFIFVIIKVI